ncbi:MAG: aminotransferase class V-fold PLP-dependent enzyme [Dehalococcoidales bacterium]|nr:aminotransferase class V-fold PLP-dependent enzyme [Dehalococcoidales bacterium]
MIYLDNAATSWPKPPEVLKAIADVLERAGGNPGRSGHRLSISAAQIVYDTREAIAQLFNCHDPMKVIFTGNATHAINLALYGLLKPGDHVVVTSMEHNAVMRPLRDLENKGIKLDIAQCNEDGSLDVGKLAKVVSNKTKLVVAVHASNVTGTLLPIDEIARIAHRAGALLLVDAAQAAGAVPIDIQTTDIDLLAFTGHKGLLGPTGIGGLVIGESVDVALLSPFIRGGTGSQSELDVQPDYLPDKYESGTPNTVGIAGLGAGIRWLQERGVTAIRENEKALTQALIEGLSVMKGVKVYGCRNSTQSVATVSFTVAGQHVSDIGFKLDEKYDILARVGLHCAPLAHKTIGSFPEGTVRLALGVFTTPEDIRKTLIAIEKVVRK